jgi:hypothetical protein
LIAGAEGRQASQTGGTTVNFGTPVELHLVVEGEQAGGLPVYCTGAARLRIAGRAVPKRMVLSPEAAGLQGAEVHWQALNPTKDGRHWTQRRVDAWDHHWSASILDFPGGDDSSADKRLGSMRFAVAIEITGSDGARRLVESDGWRIPSTPTHPESAPGFRLTRHGGQSLAGRALGFSRLPVVPGLPVSYARAKVALAPIDVVLAAYEDMAEVSLEGPRDAPLGGAEWSWLFETVARGLMRRSLPNAPLVTPQSGALAYGVDGVLKGDVLVVGEHYAILQGDNVDGWLSEDDRVLHATSGTIRSGTLSDVSGSLNVLRPRNFQPWRRRLAQAGYGELGLVAFYTANLAQACREFQRDHGMEVTGLPDDATSQALDDVLAAMDAVDDDTAATQSTAPPGGR